MWTVKRAVAALLAANNRDSGVFITQSWAVREDISDGSRTLAAAAWVILITSLDAIAFSSSETGELYRARWRIEMAFKRLKSIVGLSGPPGQDPEVAKTWILAHLLMSLLLEPHTSAPEISPRLAA